MDVNQPGTPFHSEHVITKADLRDHFAAVVQAVNDVPGPQLRETPGKGYGLFAERAYKIGEPVTVYGGVWVSRHAAGPYVISFGKTGSLDGEYGFLPDEKGRWINDPQTVFGQTPKELKALENVNGMRGRGANSRKLVFYATRDIKKGEELLWYYGNEYERHWISDPSEQEEEEMEEEEEEPLQVEEAQSARRLSVLERLQLQGVDDAGIQQLRLWLAPHGYTLASFDVSVAQKDPERFAQLPRDVRYLLMRHVIDGALAATENDPCVGVAYLMSLASEIASMADVMDRDDGLWQRFFVHDFQRFDEQAGSWIHKLARPRAMPWRCAYLWTVFFRRRCLRELARRRHSILAHGWEQFFKPLSFGARGCVTALAVYGREWNFDWDVSQRPAELMGYVGPFGLRGAGQFVHPSDDDIEQLRVLWGIETVRGRDLLANPGQQLYAALHNLPEGLNPAPSAVLAAWIQALEPVHEGSLASKLPWSYGAALLAYCWFQSVNPAHASAPLYLAILNALPDYPKLGDNLFVGAQISGI